MLLLIFLSAKNSQATSKPQALAFLSFSLVHGVSQRSKHGLEPLKSGPLAQFHLTSNWMLVTVSRFRSMPYINI